MSAFHILNCDGITLIVVEAGEADVVTAVDTAPAHRRSRCLLLIVDIQIPSCRRIRRAVRVYTALCREVLEAWVLHQVGDIDAHSHTRELQLQESIVEALDHLGNLLLVSRCVCIHIFSFHNQVVESAGTSIVAILVQVIVSLVDGLLQVLISLYRRLHLRHHTHQRLDGSHNLIGGAALAASGFVEQGGSLVEDCLLQLFSQELVECIAEVLVNGKCVLLHIAFLQDAEVIDLEPAVATSTIALCAVGSSDVAIGAQTEGERAVEDESTYRHLLQLCIGDGFLKTFEAPDFLRVEQCRVIATLLAEELHVQIAEDALCGATRAIAVGANHHGSLYDVGARLQSADGLREFDLGNTRVPNAIDHLAVLHARAVGVDACPAVDAVSTQVVGRLHLVSSDVEVPASGHVGHA